jgi:hypothetical protein
MKFVTKAFIASLANTGLVAAIKQGTKTQTDGYMD